MCIEFIWRVWALHGLHGVKRIRFTYRNYKGHRDLCLQGFGVSRLWGFMAFQDSWGSCGLSVFHKLT